MKFQDNVAMLSRISPELVAAVANEAS